MPAMSTQPAGIMSSMNLNEAGFCRRGLAETSERCSADGGGRCDDRKCGEGGNFGELH